MKALNYLRYFIYIAVNWSPRLALFTVYHEIRGERKYHINSTGTNDLSGFTLKGKYKNEAEVYQGASYLVMEKLFSFLIGHTDHKSIVDFGCGKGRVLAVAAHFGFRKITGVEFAQELVRDARHNMDKISTVFPETTLNVVHENAVNYPVENDAGVFFFFNPFKETVMKKVIANILMSIKKSPRKIFVIYVNPQLKGLFLEAGFREVFFYKRMEYVEGVVLELGT